MSGTKKSFSNLFFKNKVRSVNFSNVKRKNVGTFSLTYIVYISAVDYPKRPKLLQGIELNFDIYN